jgi:hypothetical protein
MTITYGSNICEISHNLLVLSLWGIINNFLSVLANGLLLCRNSYHTHGYGLCLTLLLALSFFSSFGIIDYFVSYHFYSDIKNDCNKKYYYTVLVNSIVSVIHICFVCLSFVFFMFYCGLYNLYFNRKHKIQDEERPFIKPSEDSATSLEDSTTSSEDSTVSLEDSIASLKESNK